MPFLFVGLIEVMKVFPKSFTEQQFTDLIDPTKKQARQSRNFDKVNSYLQSKAIQQPQPNQIISNASYHSHRPNPIVIPMPNEMV